MRVIIRKVEYNTKKARLIKKTRHGHSSNESDYTTELCLGDNGRYFIHAYGGIDSKYPDEEIIPITADAAKSIIEGKSQLL